MQLGATADDPHVKAGVNFLRHSQRKDGSWFGRWGVNHIYGMVASGVECRDFRRATDGQTRHDWLVSIRTKTAAGAKGCDSYKLDCKGYERAILRVAAAWALMGLMAAGEVTPPSPRHPLSTGAQRESGLWPEETYTGGGFPRVFYLAITATRFFRSVRGASVSRAAFARRGARAVSVLAVVGLKREATRLPVLSRS